MIETQLFTDDIYLIFSSWAALEASLKIIGSGLLTAIPPWPGTAMSNRTWALILSMIESQLFNDDIYLILPSWAVLEASLKIIGSGLLTALPLARDSRVEPNIGFDHKHD